MKIQRRKLRTAEVYTASLNDIMFFLMLFFLIVSTMIAPATMRVVLPSSKTSTDAAVRNQVNLTVTADLHYLIEDKEVAYEQIEPILAGELAAKPEAQETVVLLHADKSLNLQNVVDLFDIGNKLKIKMILFTQKEKK
ncbi:MAG: biopolymer transporter ExbD [Prevotellaceae bacterium]|jgi:biopolymer transport protein ExbD|nr:biopolymer transporter ExbD [Prevotellaceae bacterium]